MADPKKSGLLKLSLIFILSSTIFDLSNLLSNPFTEQWLDIHLFLKDLMYIGFAILCYIQTPYNQLKLKTLLFMLCIWRVFVIAINTVGLADNKYSLYFIIGLYALYAAWLIRIFCIDPIITKYNGDLDKNHFSYNIFIPVHSFRGILKALVLIHTDPRYETTILVHKKKVYYVRNNNFHMADNRPAVMDRLINKTSARVSIKSMTPTRLKKIKSLVHKRSITGIRDCRKLEI